jgi:glycine betaine/proline transport system permease protein
MVAATASAAVGASGAARLRAAAWWAGAVATLAVAQAWGARGFPESWNLGMAEPINDAQRWIQTNRGNHWVFVGIFTPLSRGVEALLDATGAALEWLPWYVPALAAYLVLARVGRWMQGAVAAVAVLYPGVVGLWQQNLETIALMAVSVAISVAIGVPLGIWTALSRRVEAVLRPVLDAMQTVPATVYLIPVVLVFGIGAVPAAIATVIYALPPAVRLTALGIRQVPPAAVEASRMYGATRWQTLRDVQVPLATPSILAGINQTVMMALGIVVIASLVGAGGLGQEIMRTVRLLSPGRSLLVGLAVVTAAFVLDRVSMSFVREPGAADARWSPRRVRLAVAAVVVAAVVGKVAGVDEFPINWGTSFADPVDRGVAWVRDTFDVVTRPFNDFLVREVLLRVRTLLTTTLAWQAVVLGATALAARVAGRRLAVVTAVGLFVIGATGTWAAAADTLAQTLAAVVLSALIAIPVGAWVGRHPRAEAALSPVFDAFQTIPSLVYAIPFVMIFTVGPVPGVVAAVVYAIPPGIRLTALGIKQVDREAVEAATTFGATPRQVMLGVRVPLAMPSIVLAVNQMVMMVLAMAIIAGMVGGEGLGYRAVEALTRGNTGLGVEVGLAIVVMATILDRLTQAVAQKAQPPAAH